MNEIHYRKLERMYLASNVNTMIYDTTQVTIGHETAEISLEVTSKYHHALNAMHGSVYFKLLDDAAFFAVNSIVEDVFVLTTSFNIHLIRPASQGRIRSIGKVKYASRNLFVAEATLFNLEGKEIGFGTGNFTQSKVRLETVASYK